MTREAILKHAAEYLNLGYSVIPVGQDKRPLVKWQEHQSRKAEIEEIEKWVSEFPNLNLGIVTGKISNLVVVDVEAGGSTDGLPPTAIARTGGGGWHFYYRLDNHHINNSVRLKELTDIRGEGGYVVAPPSSHASGGSYEWLTSPTELELASPPSWLLETTIEPHRPNADWNRILQEAVPEGSRNMTAAQIAGKLLHHLPQDIWELSGWPALKAWSSQYCIPPLSDKELMQTWTSIKNRELKQQAIKTMPKVKNKEQPAQELSFYENGELVAETIYNPSFFPDIQFAIYNKEDNTHQIEPEIYTDAATFEPVSFSLIRQGQVKLPSTIGNYSSEAELISDIEQYISRYLELPHDFYLHLASHYVLLTWVYDRLSVVPYLRAVGDYGSGKTRFAQVIGSICYKSMMVAGATSDAFLFRVIELFKGTLIVNELERVNTDMRSQITIILNNGYERGMPVGRVEGDRVREPRVFEVFSPKIITSREKFNDLALESRILSVPMRPTKRKDIPSLLDASFDNEALELRNKLLRYRLTMLSKPWAMSYPREIETLEPRLRQTLLPLFSIIKDEATTQEFIRYAKDFQGQIYSDRGQQVEAIVAEKVIELLAATPQVTVKNVADAVNKEIDSRDQLSSKAIGKILTQFGFKSKKQQGRYYVPNSPQAIQYLQDRFNLSIESLPSLQSLLPQDRDEVDIGDLVDLDRPLADMNADEQLAVGKQIFGEGTQWVE